MPGVDVLPLVCAFGGAAAVTGVCTPFAARAAERLGVVDRPGGRRMHTRPTPRMGGVALAMGLVLGASTYGLAFGLDALLAVLSRDDLLAFLLPCLMVFIVGLVDDVRGLSPGPRIAVEAVAAGFLVQSGYVIDVVANPFSAPIELGIFAYPVTIAWFVGITNAFNLIDGLDGLLGSVSLTALLGCAAIALLGERSASAMLSMAAAGATTGFLLWNWHPARVFMGDSGSLLLGMATAALSLKVARNPSGTLAFHVPLLLCGLPIAETILTLARRHVSGHPYLSGDRSHIHHVLINKGLPTSRAVLSLAVVSTMLAATAVASRNWRERELLVTSITLLALASLALRWLGYLEIRVLRDRLQQLLSGRGRRGLSDLVTLAAAGEAIGGATSFEDLKARLRVAVQEGRFEFLAIEFSFPVTPECANVIECRNSAAARFVAGHGDNVLWIFSAAASPATADGTLTYSMPLANSTHTLGRLVCQRAITAGSNPAEAVMRYIAAPLTLTLSRLSTPAHVTSGAD